MLMDSKELIFLKNKLFETCCFVSRNQEDLKSIFLFYSFGGNFLFFNFKDFIFFNNFIFIANLNRFMQYTSLISLVVNLMRLFLKGLTQGFFVEFKIIGLGFRVKKSRFLNTRSLRFDIGFSHIIRLVVPNNIKVFRVKRRFLIFSNDFFTIDILKKKIAGLSQLNPYKLRGLKLTKLLIKMKQGKKQNKR